MTRLINKNRSKNPGFSIPLKRSQAIRIMESSYLSAVTALIWIALYYLPIGSALFRLSLPLPLALLQMRRGGWSGLEGVAFTVLLLSALMGPVRGPLVLFPYGMLAFWLGLCWQKGLSWWFSWSVGVLIGTFGFCLRVLILSFLVGENLWVVITRAGYGLVQRFVELFSLQVFPEIGHVQFVAFLLVIVQEMVYVLTLHALAFWIFPRLKARMPDPPDLLHGLVSLDSI